MVGSRSARVGELSFVILVSTPDATLRRLMSPPRV
jgi:hypothetical protein